MLENVEKNLHQWDQKHGWSKDGDEWSGQASMCGIPYAEWKKTLVDSLIMPEIGPQSSVIEIAPGHGRWTEFLLAGSAHVTIVDISPNCLNFCRGRFDGVENIDYFLTPGNKLPHHASGAIDFLWSYDSFVHMDRNVIEGYLAEMKRVLKVGGRATLHHANIDDVDNHVQAEHKGWRSPINERIMKELAEKAGLQVVRQFVYWDEERKIGVPRFNDRITQLLRAE
jgi:ubiquinone/menaquinone biosynthesis C-methylase UbiE